MSTGVFGQLESMNAEIADMNKHMADMEANYNESLDTIWMLAAAALVFFMHAGFCMLESGCVRAKNSPNIMVKNLIVIVVGFVCWWAFGWAFAYGAGDDPNKVLGTTQFFSTGFMDDKTLFRNFFFQGVFCATSGTIVSGSMAERVQLGGFGIYACVLCTMIYPVVVYWGWSGVGFLSYTDDAGDSVSVVGPAYIDFAGSGLVHLTGGVGGLCGAAIAGPRTGRFDPNVDQAKFEPHNVPFVVWGTLVLWFGWFGFNGGSTLSMHDADTAYTAGVVCVNTALAPCVTGLVVFTLKALVLPPRILDITQFCNGILAGLVSITAGCAAVKVWEAIVIGFIAGFIYMGASQLLKRLKIDDVVDAFPVHGACGIWGVLALGFFGNPDDGFGGNGAFYGGDQIVTQLVAVIIIVGFVSLVCVPALLLIHFAGLLRLSAEFQEREDGTKWKAFEDKRKGDHEENAF